MEIADNGICVRIRNINKLAETFGFLGQRKATVTEVPKKKRLIWTKSMETGKKFSLNSRKKIKYIFAQTFSC